VNSVASKLEPGPLQVGPVALPGRALLAPMSGVTDLPFRRLALRLGASMVVTEMIASRDLALQKPDTLRRAEGDDAAPLVVQLAGREARWMAEGARVAQGMGADVIDINMGCPAKQVTRGASGSALMRNEDHALSLIEATVAASSVPVTLKMRMGWDHENLNAPSLARRAEAAGVQMITVHGRTRCQFFKGRADWGFVALVKASVSVPVIVNGDATAIDDIPEMLAASSADGVMIGRGAYGRPWFPGRAARYLAEGKDSGEPPAAEQKRIALDHYDAMLCHYGSDHGVRISRKHLGWYVESGAANAETARSWRARLCKMDDPHAVAGALAQFFDMQMEAAA
jgi:tRNA-dihydrouridine synthase B